MLDLVRCYLKAARRVCVLIGFTLLAGYGALSCKGDLSGGESKQSDTQPAAQDPRLPDYGCDVRQVFEQYGCVDSGCHGERYEGDVDLLSEGYESRLVGRRSTTDACSGEPMIDTEDPESSLILRLVDPERYAATDTCGRLMPLGGEPLAPQDIACVQAWVEAVSESIEPEGPRVAPFEPLAVETYVAKVKNLIQGGAPTAEEIAQVAADPNALRSLAEQWAEAPRFEQKMKDFFAVALQQRLTGRLDPQLYGLKGGKATRERIEQNVEESFVRTAWRIVEQGQPFTEITSTPRWEVTTGLLMVLAFTDRSEAEIDDSEHTLQRVPLADQPPAPWSWDYQVRQRRWLQPLIPEGCDFRADMDENLLLQLLLGMVGCRRDRDLITDEGGFTQPSDFSDWRTVELVEAGAGESIPFYDVPALRQAKRLALHVPRRGFFTTPAFLANWDTNIDNQFRVTTSQTVITALGREFSPADQTKPARLEGLAEDHAAPGTVCYGCHQFVDPMRTYFQESFDYDYHHNAKPLGRTASFAFHGAVADGGNLGDFAVALGKHPAFASAWVQKLCYYANSQACDTRDEEFIRIAKSFTESGFDFRKLVLDLFTSPLVTGAEFTKTYASREFLISITRQQHLCRLLQQRLGLEEVCEFPGVDDFIGLIPDDDFTRGSAMPAQTALTSSFHAAAVEQLCAKTAEKVTGNHEGRIFRLDDPEASLLKMVVEVMALPPGHPRHAAAQEALARHYQDARDLGLSQNQAMRSAFTLACMSPDVMGLGL